MLKQSNLRCVIAASAMLLIGASATAAAHRVPARLLPAATAAPVVNVSLVTSDDCCPPAPAPVCKVYKPCIQYRGGLDCCGPKVSQVLQVKDPCDCCCSIAEIPVCLPACCKEACVSSKCGLFGRGVVTYKYDCGVCLTIVFRNCGDVIVVYRG